MNDTELTIEIWNVVRDSIPTARKSDIAYSLLKTFIDLGYKFDTEEVSEEDPHLDKAIQLLDVDDYDSFEEEYEDDI